MENFRPGFRFRPTDEELVNYYLRNKINGNDEAEDVIAETDVFKRDPTELPGLSALVTSDPEWYFFCPVDTNYPDGQRLNRASDSGYWISTGLDRQIKSGDDLIGMKKTLVFYRGRGTTAERTNWVMHEYRATATDTGPAPATAQSHFVLCRVFGKQRKPSISEPVPELTPESLTPIFDIANMIPQVEGQSSDWAPVSEKNQMGNLLELEQPPQDCNLSPMYSPMPTPCHQLEAGNISFNFHEEEFWSQLDATIIMENGAGEGSHAPPHLEAQGASFTWSSGSTAGQFHDGPDGLHDQTHAQTDQGSVKQGKAPRRCRLQTRRWVRPVESRDESFMPEEHESKSIDKEGLKAAEKEIAVVGHSATIDVSELKKNPPLEPSSSSEELITNDSVDYWLNCQNMLLISPTSRRKG